MRIEQLGFHWRDFQGICYWSIFLKYVGKIQFSLQSEKNNGYFARRPTHILITSRLLSLKMRNVSEKM